MVESITAYWKQSHRLLLGAFAILCLALWIPPFELFEDRASSMLQSHLLIELFSVIVSALIVTMAWHEQGSEKPGTSGVLMAGFLAVAIVDLIHALTYEGMPRLITESSTPRAIFFWLAGRTLAVLTLIAVALHWQARWPRSIWLFLALALSAALFWLGTFGLDLVPNTFVRGQGVTPFKTGYEYFLVGLNLLAAGLFVVRGEPEDRQRSHALATACLIMGMGEMIFANYKAPSDFLNHFGHLYKVASYLILYRTIYVSAVTMPFFKVKAAEAELRLATQQLAEQGRALQSTFANMSQGVVQLDAEGRVSMYNQRFTELLDLPADLLATRPTAAEVLAFQKARGDFDDADVFMDDKTRTTVMEGRLSDLKSYVRKTQQGRLLEIKSAWFDDGAMMRTYSDVTDYVRVNEALRRERERLDAILDGTRAGTWEWNILTGEAKFNARWAEIIGYTLENLPLHEGGVWSALIEPEDLPRANDLLHKNLRRELDFYECEFRMRHKAGHSVWVLARGRVQSWTADGKAEVMSGIHLDISDLKRTEEALLETSAELIDQGSMLQTTLESISQGIYMLGEDGRVSTFNRQVCVMLDVPAAIFAARPTIQELTRYQIERGDFGSDMSLVDSHARDYVAAAGEGPPPTRYLRRTRSGRVLEVTTRELGNGSLVRTFSDVTEYFETREALVASEARSRVIAESAHDAILVADARGTITYANPAAEACFGYAEQQLDGQSMSLLIPQRNWVVDSGTMQDFVAADGSAQRRLVTHVLWAQRADGEKFPVEASIAKGVVGEETVISVIVRDVSERIELDARRSALSESLERRVAERTVELERSMKDMEAISYSMAHDLRAPLRSVNGFAAILQDQEAGRMSEQGREKLGRIMVAARNMGAMIDDLLGLFRVVRAELVTRRVDMQALAQEALEALGPSAANTEIRIGELPVANGDITLLRQLFFNLIDNALKYSRKAAKPVVEIGYDPAERAYFVRDNGVGFDMAYAGKLFGVFQRLHTAAEFEGTGVGLSIVARIVERHGGRIWADAALGAGAKFSFTLSSAR